MTALYSALGLEIHNQCAPQLGAACDEDCYVIVDAHGATSIAGLYAAGAVSQGLNQIAVSIGNAATAASAMHRTLLVGEYPAAGAGLGVQASSPSRRSMRPIGRACRAWACSPEVDTSHTSEVVAAGGGAMST